MWITNANDDTVSVIRVTDRETVKTLTTADGVGDKPSSIAFDGYNMWIGNELDDTVSVFRLVIMSI